MLKRGLAPSLAGLGVLGVVWAGPALGQPPDRGEHPDIRWFLEAGSADGAQAEFALRQIADRWRDGYAGILWDVAWLVRPPSQRFLHFFTVVNFLGAQTGQRFGPDLARWHDWIWDQPYDPHPDYGYFKGQWYAQIDPRFADFFPRGCDPTSGSTRSNGAAWP